MMKFKFLLLLSYCCLGSHLSAQTVAPLGYDFEAPVLLANLPKELKEISGLGLGTKAGELVAVQDENGSFFNIDINTGKLISRKEFWKNGDYEGIETVGNDIWVVKNTGTLYRVRFPGTIEQEVTKFNGFLNEDNDVEGLAYDAANNRLLLCCKSFFGGSKEKRSVFAFDLSKEQFTARPVMNVGREQIQAYLDKCPHYKRYNKTVKFINDNEDFKLGPSAIAIHPITGQIFLLSSAGKLVLVMSPAGEIEHMRRLDKDLYLQPEGMVFTPNGTLYISSEGRKEKPACILRLKYMPGFSDL